MSNGRLPTFLVIGAMKAGTTSLHTYLAQHPGVFMSEQKELNYFSAAHNLGKGVDWYRAQFAGAGDAVAVGESSPGYTMFPFFPDPPARIAELLPEVRLVYILRDPIERMRSEYIHARSRGFEKRPINQALLEGSRYLLLSSYSLQIEQYLRHVKDEQLLLVTSEDLRADRERTLTTVLEHIGVSPQIEAMRLNTELHSSEVKRSARVPSYALNKLLQDRTEWLPERGRTALQAATTRAFRPDELRIDDSVRERLLELLRPDLARLVTYLPNGSDRWDVDSA